METQTHRMHLEFSTTEPRMEAVSNATLGERMGGIGRGESQLLGQGVKRMAREDGDPNAAVHVHGMELAAYLGNTGPGAASANLRTCRWRSGKAY